MKKFLQILALGILLGSVACGSNATATPYPTALPPTATAMLVPASTPIPLYMSVKLSSLPFSEYGMDFTGDSYSITTITPFLTGNLDPRIIRFNDQMSTFVKNKVDGYRPKSLYQMATPDPYANYLDIKFTQISPPGNLLSLRFTLSSYCCNAPHPDTYYYTSTYDLEVGKFLSLRELFLPGSNYLYIISDYCLMSIKTTGLVYIEEYGVKPTFDNYRNWNIAAEGILITFDRYQVSSYSAGPFFITVPYSELQSVIDPQGPLAGYTP